MSENTTQEKGLFETLEEKSHEYMCESHEHPSFIEQDESRIEFLVQDMFLDHFFP